MTVVETITAYLRAIERRDHEAVAALQAPAIEVVEHPNKLNPAGKRYDRAALRAAAERGRAVLSSERYDVRSMIVDGDRAAAQIAWTGILAVAYGDLPVGHAMTAQICSVFELRDGKIYRQEQYDCFE